MNAMVSGGFGRAVIGLRGCRLLPALLVAALALAAGLDIAVAGPTVRQGVAAMARQDYLAAAAILAPIAQRGNPQAQSYLGYLYEMGRGVPQDYTQAALWYRRAAEQGHSGAQFELGLLYDRGQGVPLDVVEAEKWLILATAGSSRVVSDDRARIRDAVRTKMTRGELAQARARALAWQSHPEQ